RTEGRAGFVVLRRAGPCPAEGVVAISVGKRVFPRLRRLRNSHVHEDIGKKLIEARLIDAGAIAKAQQQMKSVGGGLTATLVKIGAITEESLLEFLANFYRVPSVDLRT